MYTDSLNTAFEDRHTEGLHSFEAVRVNEKTVQCRTSVLQQPSRQSICPVSAKTVCEDCCFVKFSISACGSPVIWESTRVLDVAVGFTESDYCAYDEFVYYEDQQIESFFPQAGGASDGAQISLSEAADTATIFLSNDVILRLVIDGSKYDFGAVVSNGIGMLTGYPQIDIHMATGVYLSEWTRTRQGCSQFTSGKNSNRLTTPWWR